MMYSNGSVRFACEDAIPIKKLVTFRHNFVLAKKEVANLYHSFDRSLEMVKILICPDMSSLVVKIYSD